MLHLLRYIIEVEWMQNHFDNLLQMLMLRLLFMIYQIRCHLRF